ncbi:MAG: PRA1 family protein [Ruminococcus sp.]|nr:PRA1 family protein [Ruminococcus sp.]
MSKRKHRRKKQLSDEEKEHRRQLAEKRKERQKLEKKRMIAEFSAVTLTGIIFLAIMILSAIFNPKLLVIFLIAVAVIFILLLDQSGIRSFLFRWYPDKFVFAEELKEHDTKRSVPMQLASTISWYMFMLMLFSHSSIFSVIWLICVGVGLYYMLTDERYSLEKGAKYECSLLYLLLTPIYVLIMVMYNVRITKPFIVFTAVFTVIFSLIYAVCIHNGNKIYTRLIYGIIVSVACASSGFLLINKNLDFSEPHQYRLTVEDKDYSSGRSSTYYIYTQDWKNPDKLLDIKVNRDKYYELEIGDSVIIEAYNGTFNAEHYEYIKKAPVQ